MSDSNKHLPSDPPSKSQKKREMITLQKLGEALVLLSAAQLETIPLEGLLLKAVMDARVLKGHEAKRRQAQYIGRLIRNVDVTPIEEALAKLQLKDQLNITRFHQVEKWRDKLIAEGDTQLEEFLNKYPDTDRQHLRQLVRNAQQNKRGADTELFRFIREWISQDKPEPE